MTGTDHPVRRAPWMRSRPPAEVMIEHVAWLLRALETTTDYDADGRRRPSDEGALHAGDLPEAVLWAPLIEHRDPNVAAASIALDVPQKSWAGRNWSQRRLG